MSTMAAIVRAAIFWSTSGLLIFVACLENILFSNIRPKSCGSNPARYVKLLLFNYFEHNVVYSSNMLGKGPYRVLQVALCSVSGNILFGSLHKVTVLN